MFKKPVTFRPSIRKHSREVISSLSNTYQKGEKQNGNQIKKTYYGGGLQPQARKAQQARLHGSDR